MHVFWNKFRLNDDDVFEVLMDCDFVNAVTDIFAIGLCFLLYRDFSRLLLFFSSFFDYFCSFTLLDQTYSHASLINGKIVVFSR